MNETPGPGTRPSTSRPNRMTARKGVLVAVLAVVIAFFVGFFWQWYVAGNVRSDLARAEQELQVERLRVHLAQAAMAAHADDFEGARALMSDFFTRLQEHRDELPADLQSAADDILSQRDDVITGLSRSNREYAGVLQRMLSRITGDPAISTPPGDDPTELPSPDATGAVGEEVEPGDTGG